MHSLADAAKTAQDRLAELAEYKATHKAQIIADGVDKYGWSPDADCANCGDTGMWPNSLSFCGCAAGNARQLRDREAKAATEWERRWQLTNVPRRFRGYRLGSSPLPAELVAIAAEWCERKPTETGANLIITGSIGCGKTGLAIGALYELHQSGVQPLWFISTSSLIDAMKPGGDESSLVTCQKAAVLVLDDLGTTRGTDWEQERLFALLNARYEDERPTIVTTNVTIPDLAASVGARTVSRLMEQHMIVPVDGPDMRRMSAGSRAA